MKPFAAGRRGGGNIRSDFCRTTGSKVAKKSNLLREVNWRAGLVPDSGESGYDVEDVEGVEDAGVVFD